MRNSILGLLCLSVVGMFAAPAYAQTEFLNYCFDSYQHQGKCPENICELTCAKDKKGGACASKVCLPVECPKIDADHCPAQFCQKMVNCSDDEICNYPMVGEKAQCGDLAYAGQDVDCCRGLVRRCGIQFIDGSCDMEGKDSVYELPICIPCGDGVCGQFENRCNCPEDCSG